MSFIICISFGTVSIFADEVDEGFDFEYTFMTETEFNNDFEQFVDENPQSADWGMKTYFQNLYEYSPMNSHGSCG